MEQKCRKYQQIKEQMLFFDQGIHRKQKDCHSHSLLHCRKGKSKGSQKYVDGHAHQETGTVPANETQIGILDKKGRKQEEDRIVIRKTSDQRFVNPEGGVRRCSAAPAVFVPA